LQNRQLYLTIKLDFEITPQTEKELIFDNEEEVDIINNNKTKERLKKRIQTYYRTQRRLRCKRKA